MKLDYLIHKLLLLYKLDTETAVAFRFTVNLLGVVFFTVMMISIACVWNAGILILLPIVVLMFIGMMSDLLEDRAVRRKYLYVDYLEDYLHLMEKYKNLEDKHDKILKMKNTKTL